MSIFHWLNAYNNRVRTYSGYPLIINPSSQTLMRNTTLYGNSIQDDELPEGYTRLEYLESSGTQYLQLNYGFAPTDEIEFKNKISSKTSDMFLVSPTTWSTSSRFAMGGVTNANRSVGYGNTTTSVTVYNPTITDTTYIQEVSTETYSNNVFSISSIHNNSTYDASSVGFSGETNNLKLFYGYNKNSSGRIYLWKHKKDGVLVEYLIPAKRNSDSALGMYDLVTDTFFENAGTGTFTAGPEVPTPNAPLEIESVGDKTKNLFDKSKITFSTTEANMIYESFAIPNGTYTFSSNIPKSTYADIFILAGKVTSGASTASNGITVETPRTITVTDGYYTIANRQESTRPAPRDYNYLLEEGSEVTDYVPYGYAIPILEEGKNLVSKVLKAGLNNNKAYIEDISEEVTSPYTLVTTWRGIGYYAKVKPNTTYTVSGSVTGAYASRAFVSFYENEADVIDHTKELGSVTTSTFTTPSNANYVVVVYISNAVGNIITFEKLQLEEGSIVTSYQEYQTPVTTNVFLDEPLRKVLNWSDSITILDNGVNLFDIDDVTYGTWTGDSGTASTRSAGCRTTYMIKCEENDSFTLTWDTSNPPYSGSFVFFNDSNTFVKRLLTAIKGTGIKEYTVTVPTGATKFFFQTYNADSSSAITRDILLSYKVRVKKNLGKSTVKVVRQIGKISLDENNSYTLRASQPTTGAAFYENAVNFFTNLTTSDGGSNRCLCEEFSYVTSYKMGLNTCNFVGGGTNIYRFHFTTDVATTVDELKEWLTINPITFIYLLKDSTEEYITCDNIRALPVYTKITANTEVEPSDAKGCIKVTSYSS